MKTLKAELKDIKPTFVSYVKKGANKKTFFLTKSDKPNDNKFEKNIQIFFEKQDPKKLIYGVVYTPNEIDTQGDYATEDEIEKAAHQFLKDARNIDKQHDFVTGAGEVVESYISPIDFTLGEQEVKKGAWVLVTKATDEIWEEVIKGDITGYSMAGKAVRTVKQNTEEEQAKGLLNVIKTFFSGTPVSGTDTPNSNNGDSIFDEKIRLKKLEELTSWRVTDALQESLREIINSDSITNKDTEMYKAIDAFANYLKGNIKATMDRGIAKADIDFFVVKNDKGDVNMTKQELESTLNALLEPLNEKVSNLEKGEVDVNNASQESISKSDIEEVIAKSLLPIVQRIEQIEKTRSVSKQISDNQTEQPMKKENSLFSNLGI